MEQMIEFYQQTKDIDYRAVSETLRKAVEMDRLVNQDGLQAATRRYDAQVFQMVLSWQHVEQDWYNKKDALTDSVRRLDYRAVLELLDSGHEIECMLYDADPSDTETLHRMLEVDKLCQILENLIEE